MGQQKGSVVRCLIIQEIKFSQYMLYKKDTRNEFARIRKLTSSSSPWVEQMKSENVQLCEYVGKLKGIGNQEETKINEMNIHTIADLQKYV